MPCSNSDHVCSVRVRTNALGVGRWIRNRCFCSFRLNKNGSRSRRRKIPTAVVCDKQNITCIEAGLCHPRQQICQRLVWTSSYCRILTGDSSGWLLICGTLYLTKTPLTPMMFLLERNHNHYLGGGVNTVTYISVKQCKHSDVRIWKWHLDVKWVSMQPWLLSPHCLYPQTLCQRYWALLPFTWIKYIVVYWGQILLQKYYSETKV